MILPVYVFGHPILRKKAAAADDRASDPVVFPKVLIPHPLSAARSIRAVLLLPLVPFTRILMGMLSIRFLITAFSTMPRTRIRMNSRSTNHMLGLSFRKSSRTSTKQLEDYCPVVILFKHES